MEEIEECLHLNPKDGPSIVMKEFVQGKIQQKEVGTSVEWGGYRVLEEK
jgi:hypothetical protein